MLGKRWLADGQNQEGSFQHDKEARAHAPGEHCANSSTLIRLAACWVRGRHESYLEKAIFEGHTIKGHTVGSFLNAAEFQKCIILVLLCHTPVRTSLASSRHIREY